MAKLIKLRLAPHKHVLLQTLAIIKTNQVISRVAMEAHAARRAGVEAAMATVRARIREFCAKKPLIVDESKVRGQNRARRQLITEVLVSCAHLVAGLAGEACAIEQLARKIAANITNRPDRFQKRDEDACCAAALEGMVHITIAAPHAELLRAQPIIDKLSARFGLVLATEIADNEKGRLLLTVANVTSMLEYDPTMLRPILRAVATRLEGSATLCAPKNPT